MIARIEDLTVDPDTAAVVVVDEASGTIVNGRQCPDSARSRSHRAT